MDRLGRSWSEIRRTRRVFDQVGRGFDKNKSSEPGRLGPDSGEYRLVPHLVPGGLFTDVRVCADAVAGLFYVDLQSNEIGELIPPSAPGWQRPPYGAPLASREGRSLGGRRIPSVASPCSCRWVCWTLGVKVKVVDSGRSLLTRPVAAGRSGGWAGLARVSAGCARARTGGRRVRARRSLACGRGRASVARRRARVCTGGRGARSRARGPRARAGGHTRVGGRSARARAGGLCVRAKAARAGGLHLQFRPIGRLHSMLAPLKRRIIVARGCYYAKIAEKFLATRPGKLPPTTSAISEVAQQSRKSPSKVAPGVKIRPKFAHFRKSGHIWAKYCQAWPKSDCSAKCLVD